MHHTTHEPVPKSFVVAFSNRKSRIMLESIIAALVQYRINNSNRLLAAFRKVYGQLFMLTAPPLTCAIIDEP